MTTQARNKAILIIGQICSGKTTLARHLSETLAIPVASFGGYIKKYCTDLNLPTDRATLQETGENLIRKDPKEFLENVVSFSSKDSQLIIIEGIRHKSIFDLAKLMFFETLTIYIDITYETRYRRFVSRSKDSDSRITSQSAFLEINRHPVELEIEALKKEADLVTNLDDDKLNTAIQKFLLKSS